MVLSFAKMQNGLQKQGLSSLSSETRCEQLLREVSCKTVPLRMGPNTVTTNYCPSPRLHPVLKSSNLGPIGWCRRLLRPSRLGGWGSLRTYGWPIFRAERERWGSWIFSFLPATSDSRREPTTRKTISWASRTRTTTRPISPTTASAASRAPISHLPRHNSKRARKWLRRRL